MRPLPAVDYRANRGLRNPEAASYSGLTSPRSADFQNLGCCQFSAAVPFTTDMRSVEQFVGLIFFPRLPSQMLPIDAALMALAAGVRRLMFWCRGRTVFALTDNAADGVELAVDPNPPIALAVRRKWPNQALVAIKREDRAFQTSERLSIGSSATKRVAMPEKAGVMCLTPRPSENCLAAAFNHTYSRFSHVVSSYVRGQGRAALERCFRPVFHSRITVCSQPIRDA